MCAESEMKSLHVRPWLLVLALLVLAGWLVWHDHVITRPCRLDVAACYDNMVSVGDALLLYEKQHGSLPARLDDLVPQYVSEPMIYCRENWKNTTAPRLDTAFKYAYDPAHRRLADRQPHAVKGLWSRHASVRSRTLPPQAVAAAGSVTQAVTRVKHEGIVIEAENFSFMNYAWEIKEDPTASSGRVLMTKEHVTDNSAQLGGFGDFYNIGNNQDISRLHYRFRVPANGTWRMQARMQTGGTHCSNSVRLFVDETEVGHFGGNEIPPFRWVWCQPADVWLEAGEHDLRIYTWEDGVRFDQILISRKPVWGDTPLEDNAAGLAMPGRPLALAHDLDSAVIDEERTPAFNVWIRNVACTQGWARLTATLSWPAGSVPLVEREFRLRPEEPLIRVPLDFTAVDGAALARREYLVTSVLQVDGRDVCRRTTVLTKPFQWRILGMLPSPQIEVAELSGGWSDDDDFSVGSKTYSWQTFEGRFFDHFGVMDFGLKFANNFLNAPEYRTVYAQTVFRTPRGGVYLFKVIGDDNLTLWVDGVRVMHQEQIKPVTRSSERLMVDLPAGEHTMQYRLNQFMGCWQAEVMIRSAGDGLSDAVGVDWLTASAPGKR